MSCRFHQTVPGPDKTLMILCRKAPPVVTSFPIPQQNGAIAWATNSRWPIVQNEDWCGAHEEEGVSLRVVS